MTGLWLVSYIALWLLFLVVALVLLSVLHNLGAIYSSLDNRRGNTQAYTKLKENQVIPEINLYTIEGELVTTSAFHDRKGAFVIVSPHCSPCHQLLQNLAHRGFSIDPLDEDVRQIVVISTGDADHTIDLIRAVGLPPNIPVLLDKGGDVARVWGTTATPTTVIVDEQLKVVRHVFGFNGWENPTTVEAQSIPVQLTVLD